jgi:hypothetical protein
MIGKEDWYPRFGMVAITELDVKIQELDESGVDKAKWIVSEVNH